jgi:hypothetical protein
VGHSAAVALAQVGRDDQVGHVPAHRVGATEPEGALGRGIEFEERAGTVTRDDAIEGSLEDRRLAGFAQPKRHFGAAMSRKLHTRPTFRRSTN